MHLRPCICSTISLLLITAIWKYIEKSFLSLGAFAKDTDHFYQNKKEKAKQTEKYVCEPQLVLGLKTERWREVRNGLILCYEVN